MMHSEGTYAATARTTPRRHADRIGYGRDAIRAALDSTCVCHLGFIGADGTPLVLPFAFARDDDLLYVHGSTGAGLFGGARAATPEVCLTVTSVDGLVFARSAFNHSLNYVCVVVRGALTLVTADDEKIRALRCIVDAMAPGRWEETRQPSKKELASTSVGRIDLAECSVKTRSGGPSDDVEDLQLGHWAGTVPMSNVMGDPQRSPDLPADIALPSSIRHLLS